MPPRPTPANSNASSRSGVQGKVDEEGLTGQALLSALRALKRGEFDARLPDGLSGRDGQVADALNGLAEQLESFSEDVQTLGAEVGQDGRVQRRIPRGRARKGWAQAVDAVNGIVEDVTAHSAQMARVIQAVSLGDLTQTVPMQVNGKPLRGEFLRYAEVANAMVDQLDRFGSEVSRVAKEVGVNGELGAQATVRGAGGTWKELTDNVNQMARNLTNQVRNVSEVATAIAQGNLAPRIMVDAKGEIGELKTTMNTMVEQLSQFAGEVTRVAREVGTEGRLGGQAKVEGVAGIWRDLTSNVNQMANNLTYQVRDIAEVTTAVANGDLTRKISVEVSGEILQLKNTINTMVDHLSSFAAEVTRVARDVGVEGRLGGQAEVPGASGIWKDLTDNVNDLASNLTTQVRAIGQVATAVTKGDLTQTITVDARGEVAVLKDDLNQMIQGLAATTRANSDQDWLKTNFASFTRMLQGQRDLPAVSKQVIEGLCAVVKAQHGVIYMSGVNDNGEVELRLFASYASQDRKSVPRAFKLGEGLIGQCALEKERILISNPPADYIKISSGLGEAPPSQIVLLPVLYEGETKAVIELAAFGAPSEIQLSFLEQLSESLGIVVAGIEAQMRTDELLRESQRLTEELQAQQEELQQSNEELEEKARELGEQKSEVERKNTEIEEARRDLEEKAEQLAMTSRYKSEFLANMSHELRSPLNSLLILSQQLAANGTGNLDEKQVEFANTIYGSGTDLLHLINEVLDLAKIESGTMGIEVDVVSVGTVESQLRRSFQGVAQERGLTFDIAVDDGVTSLVTDERRLHQVLRNLLTNAFKFTHSGGVELRIGRATDGFHDDHPVLAKAESVIAFRVTDTGIGVPRAKQRLIFEAFQQAEGSSNREYGGTGLGLSISREICTLLGGEISVVSEDGKGSTFTLFLPIDVRSEQAAPKGPTPPRTAGRTAKVATKRSLRVQDDRDDIQSGDRTLLVIEDDARFAAVMRDQARKRGFKVLVCTEGQAALDLVQQTKPDAITLDLELPDVHGWVILDRLKRDPGTRHIPVHIVSAGGHAGRGLACGAIATVQKPLDQEALNGALNRLAVLAERKPRHLLVVDEDEVQRRSICALIGEGDVITTAVESAADALSALERQRFDCVVLDLKLPGMGGYELIVKIKEHAGQHLLPIIVHTGRQLSEKEEQRLNGLAESVIVKGVKSPERLLDETALFLHRVEANLPEAKQRMLRELRKSDTTLMGKHILIVDDEPRNLFATTSILENYGVQVFQAENGADALRQLEALPGIELVLMDIMMPGMDGYEAMIRLRKKERFKDLPVIAVTAKAMLGDREKCIEAGASDYITKPLDAEQLLSLLRVWLTR